MLLHEMQNWLALAGAKWTERLNPGRWQPNTPVLAGDTFIGREFVYEAQNAGTTGGVEPIWPVPALPFFTHSGEDTYYTLNYNASAATVVDGGVTWKCQRFDVSRPRQADTPVLKGHVVKENGCYWIAQADGTTGSGAVTWLEPPSTVYDGNGDTVQDGTVTWERISYAWADTVNLAAMDTDLNSHLSTLSTNFYNLRSGYSVVDLYNEILPIFSWAAINYPAIVGREVKVNGKIQYDEKTQFPLIEPDPDAPAVGGIGPAEVRGNGMDLRQIFNWWSYTIPEYTGPVFEIGVDTTTTVVATYDTDPDTQEKTYHAPPAWNPITYSSHRLDSSYIAVTSTYNDVNAQLNIDPAVGNSQWATFQPMFLTATGARLKYITLVQPPMISTGIETNVAILDVMHLRDILEFFGWNTPGGSETDEAEARLCFTKFEEKF